MTYKIQDNSIQKDNMSIPRDSGNSDYNQFIEDIALETDTVVGPDVLTEGYAVLRERAYPSLTEQLDMQYWDGINSTTLWADKVAEIKALYPKSMVESTTIGDVPDWVATEAAAWLAAKQLREYTVAIARLAQYIVSVGREEVTEMQATGEQVYNEETFEMDDVMASVVTVSAIDPVDATVEQTTYDDEGVSTIVTIENPLITTDVAERAAAQAVVDATPAAVIPE